MGRVACAWGEGEAQSLQKWRYCVKLELKSEFPAIQIVPQSCEKAKFLQNCINYSTILLRSEIPAQTHQFHPSTAHIRFTFAKRCIFAAILTKSPIWADKYCKFAGFTPWLTEVITDRRNSRILIPLLPPHSAASFLIPPYPSLFLRIALHSSASLFISPDPSLSLRIVLHSSASLFIPPHPYVPFPPHSSSSLPISLHSSLFLRKALLLRILVQRIAYLPPLRDQQKKPPSIPRTALLACYAVQSSCSTFSTFPV